jgi:hypothetical protein
MRSERWLERARDLMADDAQVRLAAIKFLERPEWQSLRARHGGDD